MYITLRNGENVVIESTRHKIKVDSDSMGEVNFSYADKETKVSDELFTKQIDKLIEKNKSWGKERLQPTRDFIINLVERGSKALKVDKNKLCSLLIEKCDYSMINYFQECNFYSFPDAEKQSKKISELNKTVFDLKKKHSEEIVKLQKEITKAKRFEVDKVEAEGRGYSDYGIRVNCPFCDRWQEVEDLGDWYPSDGEFEGNQECEGCGKIFSVKFDGDF